MDFFRIPIITKNPVYVVIDILIVSILIYKLYMVLRRTRGIQLLLGLFLIWVMGIVAEFFDLELLESILTTIRPALVFAVIVLLQPELRRITSDLANIKLLQFFFAKPQLNIDEIVKAVLNLSKSNTGSIIIITRDISHRNLVEDSVVIDSVISAPLLETIFRKDTPLHDGAVIIDQNRIAAASCYLPMSGKLEGTTYGARHRSALGFSEESDAIVVITSEETGEISICFEGEMLTNVNPNELKRVIFNLFQQRRKLNQAK